MPVTFSQIAANTATVTVRLEGMDDIHIVYFPNRVTDQLIAEINAGISDNDLLPQLIKSWDIYEDDAMTQMFPVERINEFGLPFKVAVSEAIAEHMRPNTIASQTTS